jgi:two-component system response regulator FixJ
MHVIDDDEQIRRAVAALFDLHRIPARTYESAEQFLATEPLSPPGCLLVDVHLPGMSGFDLVRRLKSEGWPSPILLMSGQGDVATAVEAMKFGALDYIEKPFEAGQLLDAVIEAREVEAQRLRRLEECDRCRLMLGALTGRQSEVLAGVLAGKSNKHMARELNVSVRTVEAHRADLMRRTGAHSIGELVRMVAVAGLLGPEGGFAPPAG